MPSLNPKPTTSTEHGLAGIQYNVEDHLLEGNWPNGGCQSIGDLDNQINAILGWVSSHARKCGRDSLADVRDTLTILGKPERARLRSGRTQVLLSKTENAVRDLSGFGTGIQSPSQRPSGELGIFWVIQSHLCVGNHGRHEIVELMGDDSGNRTESRQPLRMSELRAEILIVWQRLRIGYWSCVWLMRWIWHTEPLGPEPASTVFQGRTRTVDTVQRGRSEW